MKSLYMEKVRTLNSEDGEISELNDIKQLKKNNLLSNITCKYNLKSIFSYLKYDYVLKLIKNNKSLQNKLGINIDNYITYSKREYFSEEKKEGWNTGIIHNRCGHSHSFCFTPIGRIICLFYLFLLINIFYIIYVNINQTKLNIPFVNIANKSLYGLILLNFCFSFFARRGIHVYSLLFYIIIHILYEILIAIKTYIINKVYLSDGFFMINNFIFIIKFAIIIRDEWPNIKKIIKNYLIGYKNISLKQIYIKDFKNFKKNQKKYISNIANQLGYNYLERDFKIIEKINNFRRKNNLEELKIKYGLPDFIINEKSEVILFKSKHLFKLSDNKYLLKYEVGKFNEHFENNDKELINIILKENLNRISIVVQGNIQYILLDEYSFNNFRKGQKFCTISFEDYED